jgi:lysozyme
MTITGSEARELFEEDVAWAEDCARDVGEVEQHQFDMMVSLIFNIGAGAWRRSTVRRLMMEGIRGGSRLRNAWLAWRRSGNDRTILLPRRKREWKVFEGGY